MQKTLKNFSVDSSAIKERYWEIDAARGVAILLMVIYHTLFDLYYFGGQLFHVPVNFFEYLGGWVKSALPDFIGTLFFLLVGISAWLRIRFVKPPYFQYFIKRSLQILFFAFMITGLSAISFYQGVVYFGVLHCIGVTLLLIPFFLRIEYGNLFFGFAFIAIGIVLQSIQVKFGWLMWLGLIPKDATYGDYYPLFPWFGIALIGLFLGQFFYPRTKLREWKREWKFGAQQWPLSHGLKFLGRHSLIIYLLHQPLVLVVLYLVGRVLP